MKKVLGIGNALVDVLIRIESDALLEELGLAKGSMTLVDQDQVNAVLEKTKQYDKQKSSGGSAANAINGLARLGVDTGYIGKIGDDEFGRFFDADMQEKKVETQLLNGNQQTGKCVVLISPDGERTFATYLGAAVELDKSDLTPPMFSNGFDYFHLEGYLVQNTEMLEQAARLAKDAGLKIAIDLASFNMVEAFKDFIHRIVEEYVDVVFANEEEARVFSGHEDPEAAAEFIAKKTDIAVVKCGGDGSVIMRGDKKFKVNPIEATVVDTTGAGDLYAAGFFFGLANDYPLDACGKIGSILGGNVVQVIGAKMDEERWTGIEAAVKKIEASI
jgi:sugar/nucleoside kinase (ribokinase family)